MSAPGKSSRMLIDGPEGPLEAIVDTGAAEAGAAAVICHPHPQHGGTMHNKVVHTLARTLVRGGLTAVRFNFRGVGASAGAYDEGRGERDDALAAVRWATSRGYERVCLAGFSFGAWIAATIAADARPLALVTVAPPVARMPETFTAPACPWLIVQGGHDELVPATDVRAWRDANAPDAELVLIDDASHFFHGRLGELADAVQRFVEACGAGQRGQGRHGDKTRGEPA